MVMKKGITAIIIVLTLCASLLSACGITDESPAMKAGQTEVSLKEFRYQYNKNIEAFQNTYGTRYSKYVDFSLPLNEQQYGDDGSTTWADYFADYTLRSLKNYCLLAEDARVHGTTLTESDVSQIDDLVKDMEDYLEQSNMTAEEFFGGDITLEDYRSVLELDFLGTNRYNEYLDNLEISYEDSKTYAESKPQIYVTLSYYYYCFKPANYGASVNNAKNAANEFMESVTDISDFESLLYENILSDEEKEEYYEGLYFVKDVYYSVLNDTLKAWGYDSSRQVGDFTLSTEEDGVVLYVFAGAGLPEDYLSYTYRGIFIPFDSDLDDEQAQQQALADADSIIKEWEDGGKGEDLFASLAYKYSKDSKTYLKGGLSKNTIISGLGDGSYAWISSTDRTFGDTGVFSADKGVYILFYIEPGIPVWQSQAEEALKATSLNEYLEELADEYNFTSYANVIKTVK